jgi:hypothetical protein
MSLNCQEGNESMPCAMSLPWKSGHYPIPEGTFGVGRAENKKNADEAEAASAF